MAEAKITTLAARARLRTGLEPVTASAPRSATGQQKTKYYDSATVTGYPHVPDT
jgi:hypothetical protein